MSEIIQRWDNFQERKTYQSNPNIKLELTNIELVPLNVKYVTCIDELTKEYKKEHDERMKTTKQDELFDYVDALDYLKERVIDYDEYEKTDFDLGR